MGLTLAGKVALKRRERVLLERLRRLRLAYHAAEDRGRLEQHTRVVHRVVRAIGRVRRELA